MYVWSVQLHCKEIPAPLVSASLGYSLNFKSFPPSEFYSRTITARQLLLAREILVPLHLTYFSFSLFSFLWMLLFSTFFYPFSLSYFSSPLLKSYPYGSRLFKDFTITRNPGLYLHLSTLLAHGLKNLPIFFPLFHRL